MTKGEEEVLGDGEGKREVQGSTDLDESVDYVCQIEGKFAGLERDEERVIKLRLNRIRLEQRVKEFGYDKVGWKEKKKEREKAGVKEEPARRKQRRSRNGTIDIT